MESLLEHCLIALSGDVVVLNEIETSKIEKQILEKIHFNSQQVNWKQYPNKITISNPDELSELIQFKPCYIMWDEGTLPILEVNFQLVMKNLKAITKVAFDTWIVSKGFDWIVEFHHSDEITFTRITP